MPAGCHFPLSFTRKHTSIVATVILVATSLTINCAESSFTTSIKNNNSRILPPNAVSRRLTMCRMSSQDKDEKTVTDTIKQEEKNDFKIKAQTWNPFRLAVMKLGLTELPMTSAFNYGKYDGEFTCGYCGNVLFDSSAKYDSGSGWPSFWRSANNDAIQYKRELDGRLECSCQKCGSHLGHVFLDGPKPASVPQDIFKASPPSDPRGRVDSYLPRFCINGAAMNYHARDERDERS